MYKKFDRPLMRIFLLFIGSHYIFGIAWAGSLSARNLEQLCRSCETCQFHEGGINVHDSDHYPDLQKHCVRMKPDCEKYCKKN